MKIRSVIFLICFGIIICSGTIIKAQNKKTSSKKDKDGIAGEIKSWPEASQKAAKEMMDKYGPPSASTNDMLIWNNNGTWLKTIVYKEEIKHNFPAQHADVVEQYINYLVIPDKIGPVVKFDGSITVNRTNGTISARSDSEAMNMLTLNLAHDIVSGIKSVDQARLDYAKNAMAFKKGEKPAYTQKLNFNSDKEAPDPDKVFDFEMKLGMEGTDGPDGK